MPNVERFVGYGSRYVKTFFSNVLEFLWQQILVGLFLAVAILWSQIRHGIITAHFRENWLAILDPYLCFFGLLILWHLAYTAYSIYVEDQEEIERLKFNLKAYEPAPIQAVTNSISVPSIDLRGEILEMYFSKSDDIPAFPSCTTVLLKVQVVNHGPLEATITGVGLSVRLGGFTEIGELLKVVPDSWRIKYRNEELLNPVYVETPIESLLGHIAEEELYRTAIPRVGWVAFKVYTQANLEFQNAEFQFHMIDSIGGQHSIRRSPQVYVKTGIFVNNS